MKYPQLVSMPSAVSDWLEEQLEARGIDAVVYTRYVLSLLYRDPVDIICPDQDLHFTNPNKEVRRSGGGRKRFCRSTDYWGHANADADQLKRTAAVECLKSASDQKCGIESLVDELCEKLKEIKSDSTKSTESTSFTHSEQNKASVQDPAKRYYAAFPPLSRNSSTASPNIITLIPKWFGSPKKKGPRRQNRSSSYEEKLHFKVDTENMKARSSGKQRFNYFSRNKKDLGYCRNMSKSIERPESMSEWDFFNNNSSLKSKKSLQEWSQENLSNEAEKQKIIPMAEHQPWDESEESMYDDLPVDIRDLLDSPTPQDVNVDMMNVANMRDTGNKKFIQCGTNIISSIWSNDAPMEDAVIYDNTYNTNLDLNQADSVLDLKFSSISIDKNVWSSDITFIKENETNSFFESCNNKSLLLNNFGLDSNGPWNFGKFEKWSDTETYENDQQVNNVVSKSLMKLNHNREESSFTEVKPRSRLFAGCNKNSQMPDNSQDACKRKKFDLDKDKDDLLNSASSHFKPINEKTDTKGTGQYADGTTFVIPNSLDKVNFKRSESGTMYLEAEHGVSKKYLEYKKVNDELTLKFNVNQNDKACQTENSLGEEDFELNFVKSVCEDEFYFPGDQELLEHEEKCTCSLNKDNHSMALDNSFGDDLNNCPVHITRPDSMVAEIFGKFEAKCDKCNTNGVWSKDWPQSRNSNASYEKRSLENIWSGGEVCMTCLGLSGSGRPPPSQEQNQLREDITLDGEQLLSDLSSLQKSYMEELPIAEVSCNINELIGAKEWKQSVIEESVPIHSGSFSFATRLQQDCLLKMATIPTLRSVTL